MPALRELSGLHTADITRDQDAGEMYPPSDWAKKTKPLSRYSPFLCSITLSNLELADPIFAQLPRMLQSLHLPAMRPLTDAAVPTIHTNIARLEDLAEVSLTPDEIATPPLIRCVTSVIPHLQVLELGHAFYLLTGRTCIDVRSPAILEVMRLFPHLLRLRIFLNFMDREFTATGPAPCWIVFEFAPLCNIDGFPEISLMNVRALYSLRTTTQFPAGETNLML
ncbi:hypothetical protein B0H19DRAFT_1243097 [Mycena capillaripes]|nr:hypothetical protein B0H19DRAFT_1243097 [Mycena capillaripes]